MGELLPKGQPAVELAANQRLVALVHRAQSEQSSDRNQRAITRKLPINPIDDPAEACQGRLLADKIDIPILSSQFPKRLNDSFI